MRFSFEVNAQSGNIYRVSLTSGEEAFFETADVEALMDQDIEIIEIDLERISGNAHTTPRTLTQIAEGIANFIRQNSRSVLYYYCDDLAEIPVQGRCRNIPPQEYRSLLFSLMFMRYTKKHQDMQLVDVTIEINEGGRPLFMHLIARKEHANYVEIAKQYILTTYGK